MKQKEDLRITRTKKRIKDALIQLLQEKSYEQITIQDIADKAMINRNTFYLHYLDKADLLEKISIACLDDLKACLNESRFKSEQFSPDDFLEIIEAVFQSIEQNLAVYQSFMGKCECPNFKTLLKTIISDHISQGIQRKSKFKGKNLITLKIHTEYMTSGLVGVINLWLDKENNISTPDVLDTLYQIYLKGNLELLKDYS
ncbi:MAG TPA: TetR/AcrR family transcriptional regulator [Anaerovoracaceae bacterium]|nr:TetR/AcrR family transcriptional regulator [Anaerovoracaceae bacterium]